jgi:16S rRNA (adenine1518-N6/adenine1519-N6)-dimethyltransferase
VTPAARVSAMMKPHQTKRFLQEKLKEKNVYLKKRLGQSFLIDINMLKKIVRQAHVDGDTAVLEIGCGSGMLTQFIARKAAIVWAVEVDPRLAEIAREMLEEYDNIHVMELSILGSDGRINPDVKKTVEEYLDTHPGTVLRTVANLPYYLATSIIMELLEDDLPLCSMTFTVQKELAERLMARPRSKAYGGVSVIAQVNARIAEKNVLRRELFWPRPDVSSSLIEIIPEKVLRDEINDYGFFKELLKAAFLHRRKRLKTSLSYAAFLGDADIEKLKEGGFDLEGRAEEHTVTDFIRMSNILRKEH